MKTVRTRFAPSPTGYLHVGGLRTALYAYLLAQKHGGQFLLRIEDTDQTRLVEGATENIIKTLRWAGIEVDEGPEKGGPCGPYTQSERLDIYQKHAKELIATGHAYYCFCSPERLDKVRAEQMAQKLPPAYDKYCRNLAHDLVQSRLEENANHVIRMKIPTTGEITFNDLIRGDVTFAYKTVDDQVLMKSDGFPTYHLAVVVDDHYMKVSHVIRGEEWLSSTPKHLLLYSYFGWEAPLFAHLPLLLNSDRSKLSKRQGDVAVEEYRNKGYLPEALLNFIAFLGWNPKDTREIFSLEELIQEFSLEGVNKAGAVFNVEKLNWLNGQYIQRLPKDDLLTRVKPFLHTYDLTKFSDAYLADVTDVLRERAAVLADFAQAAQFFFEAPKDFDATLVAKMWQAGTAATLRPLLEVIEAMNTFDAKIIEEVIRDYAKTAGLSMGAIIAPLRLALSGRGQGPSVYSIMAILGKGEATRRISHALAVLQ